MNININWETGADALYIFQAGAWGGEDVIALSTEQIKALQLALALAQKLKANDWDINIEDGTVTIASPR